MLKSEPAVAAAYLAAADCLPTFPGREVSFTISSGGLSRLTPIVAVYAWYMLAYKDTNC